MAGLPDLKYVVAAEALLVLFLMVVNLYFLSKRPILRRLREIFFVNSHAFRAAWYLILVASTLLVSGQALTLATIVGVGPDFVSTLALLFQFLFTTLLIVAFAIVFGIFAKYIPRIPASDLEIETLLQADMRRAVQQDDVVTAAQLDLSHVGDVYTGRKRLGPYVSVTHYRGLTLGFAAYTERRLGHLGDALLYSVGRLTARAAMGDILREYADKEQAMRRIFDEIRANGIAIPEVVDRTEDRFTVRLYENVTSAGVPPEGKPICHYQSGMLSGIFEILTARPVLAHEVHCWALGDRFCEFQLDLGPKPVTSDPGTQTPGPAA
ncbi:MAG: hypothetical protein HYT80_00865 [Euryarchaeota archaeon]|nr:hypothetical protein [Euryarchaeota archaeon]